MNHLLHITSKYPTCNNYTDEIFCIAGPIFGFGASLFSPKTKLFLVSGRKTFQLLYQHQDLSPPLTYR